jgi:hypothetical protein
VYTATEVLVRGKPNEQPQIPKWALVLEITLTEMQRLVIFSTIIPVNVLKE